MLLYFWLYYNILEKNAKFKTLHELGFQIRIMLIPFLRIHFQLQYKGGWFTNILDLLNIFMDGREDSSHATCLEMNL